MHFISSHLFATPDNSNLFLFPLKVRVIGESTVSIKLVVGNLIHAHYLFKVGRHEGSCCRDMSQRHAAATKTCVVHNEATGSRDV